MDKQDLMNLPGSLTERLWLEDRLETLSVRESYALAAVIDYRYPPEQMADAIDCLLAMDNYEVCFPAGNYEQLGRFSLSEGNRLPEEVEPFLDFAKLGQQYQNEFPGVFVGGGYVIYPDEDAPRYDGHTPPEDTGWSVKLKLASPAVPEGVWVRLPDYSSTDLPKTTEILTALNALHTNSLADCTLLEARCILPEIGNLTEQYDSIEELVWDGTNLGFVLDERGQGKPGWMEKFAAALEYENCHSLPSALDISLNLQCYDLVPCEKLVEFGEKDLRSRGVSEKLLQSGCIDLKSYAADLLETSGYMLTSGENGYVNRNGQAFSYSFIRMPKEAPAPQEGGPALG